MPFVPNQQPVTVRTLHFRSTLHLFKVANYTRKHSEVSSFSSTIVLPKIWVNIFSCTPKLHSLVFTHFSSSSSNSAAASTSQNTTHEEEPAAAATHETPPTRKRFSTSPNPSPLQSPKSLNVIPASILFCGILLRISFGSLIGFKFPNLRDDTLSIFIIYYCSVFFHFNHHK